MDLETLIAQWSGKTPPGFVPPAIRTTGLDQCVQPRCKRKVAIKKDGTPARSCQRSWIGEPRVAEEDVRH